MNELEALRIFREAVSEALKFSIAPLSDIRIATEASWKYEKMNEIEATNEPNKPNVAGQIAINEKYGYTRLASYEGFLRSACEFVRQRNEKWWRDLNTNEPIERNVGELLMLVVSEIAEGMEGHRKNLMDDKLPHRTMLEVELADAIIRIMDLAGGLKLDLAGAWRDKMEYNATRIDHTREARMQPDGKKY